MATEIAEIPAMLDRQIKHSKIYWDTGQYLRNTGIRGIVTCARGTSDHAANFFKYLMETQTGLPVASIRPSVASVYGSTLRLTEFACVTFSQSGSSPDIISLQQAAKAGGASTIAITNSVDSRIANDADIVLPVMAGPEHAVAATKSFVGMLLAALTIAASYRRDERIRKTFSDIPHVASQALRLDWSEAALPFIRANSIFCIGRGTGLAIAAEAALKFKETCRLHAEAYSAAELIHGPMAIADRHLAALIFCTRDKTQSSIDAACKKLRHQGTAAFMIRPCSDQDSLRVPTAKVELFDPLIQSIAFYKFVEKLACNLGENPDAPPGLKKVTETM